MLKPSASSRGRWRAVASVPSAEGSFEPPESTPTARRSSHLGLALCVLLASGGFAGCAGAAAESGRDPRDATSTAVEYLAAIQGLSDSLVAADAAFDDAWAGGRADWGKIGDAADASEAIIVEARQDFAGDRQPLPSGADYAALEALAEGFDAAAAATLACVALVQRSVREESAETYYASFPCFESSNASLLAARTELQRLIDLFGQRRDL